MRNTARLVGRILTIIALAAALLAPGMAYADEAVSLGGEDVVADDQVYLGSWDSTPIAWDVESAGASLAVHSHYILFDTQIHENAQVAAVGDLSLETSELYTSEDHWMTTLPQFRNGAFSDVERAITGSFALSGDFGGATRVDGSDDWYWINEPLFKQSWSDEDWWWGFAVSPYGDRRADLVLSSNGVRPASSFDLTSVLFTSAAEGGKSGAAGAGEFAELSGASSVSAWRFTLLDSSRTVTASATGTTAAAGYTSWTVPVTFSGGGTATGDYVSAILCDSDGNALYYGTVAAATASGTQEMAMPDGLAEGTYTLRVFSERRNGDLRTDYASAFVDIPLTVSAAPTEFTVTFVDDDGTELSSATYAEGTSSADVKAPDDPAKPSTAQYDYAFAGWTPEVADVTEDATYTATYEATLRSYDVTLDLAGGTLDGQTDTVTWTREWGTTITLPEPTREGYAFQYWEGSRHDAGEEYVVEGDHAFTAVWEEEPAPATHTVTFDANGHGKAPAAQQVEDGAKAARPDDPTAEGWTFGGWYADAACTEAYDFSKPVTGDITLYAKWTEGSRPAPKPAPAIPQTGDPYNGAFGAALAAMAASGVCLLLAGASLLRRRAGR